MRKRVFICCHSQLPLGDANSNYIYHMALSLAAAGWEVIALGRGKTAEKTLVTADNLTCINLPKVAKLKEKIEGHLYFGGRIVEELNNHQICKDDYVLIYGGYVSLYTKIAKALRFLEKGHIITCAVEWPTRFQFKRSFLDPDYLLWRFVFYKMMPRWKKVVVISDNLKRHFEELGCETLVLPPMIRCKDISPDKNTTTDLVQFIYSGADIQKDAITNMLLAMKELSDEERSRLVFHITSLSPDKARNLLGEQASILDLFRESLQIHGWMEYNDLVNLYHSVDFLLLARETNQFTQSNFPSKVPEMMNYGIIPVCSRVGDYTDKYLCHMRDSVIFDGASPKDCADAIRIALSISDDERGKMRNHAMDTAKKSFDYTAWSSQLSDFILS